MGAFLSWIGGRYEELQQRLQTRTIALLFAGVLIASAVELLLR